MKTQSISSMKNKKMWFCKKFLSKKAVYPLFNFEKLAIEIKKINSKSIIFVKLEVQ